MERDSAGRFRTNQASNSGPAANASSPSSSQAQSRPWDVAPGGYGSVYESSTACAPRSAAGNVMTIVGGAALGAVAMYLLDPNQGPERRANALEVANRALETTTDTVSSAWDTMAHRAADAGTSAWAAMPSRKQLGKSGHRLTHRVGLLGASAGHAAEGWLDSARGMLPSVRRERHSRHAMEPTEVTLTALGTLALGVGAMWLLDPARGRGRRAWLVQKAQRVINETGKMARATGRHWRNKSQGYYHGTASLAGRGAGAVTDSAIAERVRSALGMLGTRGSSIGVSCTGGCVTLTGRCVTDDVNRVVDTTRDIYGVSSIVNRLEVGDLYATGTPGSTPSSMPSPVTTPTTPASTTPSSGNISA